MERERESEIRREGKSGREEKWRRKKRKGKLCWKVKGGKMVA